MHNVTETALTRNDEIENVLEKIRGDTGERSSGGEGGGRGGRRRGGKERRVPWHSSLGAFGSWLEVSATKH